MAKKMNTDNSSLPVQEEKELFEIINTDLRPFLLRNGERIDLRFGVPRNALELYKKGFPYLGLKEGAEVLFSKENEDSILYFILMANRKEDVEILAKLVESEEGKVQVQNKLKFFKSK